MPTNGPLGNAVTFYGGGTTGNTAYFDEGGKVEALGRILDLMDQHAGKLFADLGDNSPRYLQMRKDYGCNPRVSKSDWGLFNDMALHPPEHVQGDADRLAEKYGLTVHSPTITYRGITVRNPHLYQPGTDLRHELPQSTSLSKGVAQDFAEGMAGTNPYDNSDTYKGLLLHVLNRPGSRLLPNPISGQNELIIPGGAMARAFSVLSRPVESNIDPDLLEASAEHRASGGSISGDGAQGTAPPNERATPPQPSRAEGIGGILSSAVDRASIGLMSQIMGEKNGKAAWTTDPGLLEEAKAFPASALSLAHKGLPMVAALANMAGRVDPTVNPWAVGGPLLEADSGVIDALWNKYGNPAPAWSQNAARKVGAIQRAVERSQGRGDPHGFIDNAAQMGGTLLGQIPLLDLGAAGDAAEDAGKLNGLTRLLGNDILEWTTPTIRPSVANYVSGALMGGLGALGSPTTHDRGTP